MTDVEITAVPLVSIPGRVVAIVPDPAAPGPSFYTVDVNDLVGGNVQTSWWEMASDVRAYADDLDAEITGTRPDIALWDTVATIIEKASSPDAGGGS